MRLRCASAVVMFVSAGCATAPPYRVVETRPLDTRVVVSPAQGQSAEQLDRDRHECHLWAVRQSRFDPSAPGVPAAYRVRVAPSAPPGSATAAGALTGALFGAAVASPHDTGAGAIVGAIAGAAAGAAADAGNAEAVRRAQARADCYSTRYASAGNDYRRAISACLAGRGYAIS